MEEETGANREETDQVPWLQQGFDLYGKMVKSGTQGTVPLLSDPERAGGVGCPGPMVPSLSLLPQPSESRGLESSALTLLLEKKNSGEEPT